MHPGPSRTSQTRRLRTDPTMRRRSRRAPAATITIKDVARDAGVSVATVSRVLNQTNQVTADTEAQVRRAATALGYTPHAGARSLITRRTHTIGVLLPDLYGEFFSEVIRGIDQAVQRYGYHCLVSSAHHSEPQLEAVLRSMRGRVDGLVLMSPEFTGAVSARALPAGFPVVMLNCRSSESSHHSLAVANYRGARAMVKHLARLGHRSIAIVEGAAGNFDAAERLRGYRAELRAAGLAGRPELEVAGDFSEESGAVAARLLLALESPPTAIFAANDCMAIGAIAAIRDAGLGVPEDIAIGGFDDIPMARYIAPALTSVRVDISALGERAATRLLTIVEQERNDPPTHEIIPTTLVVRQSCGASRK
jgi:LacI family transcriptional regulator